MCVCVPPDMHSGQIMIHSGLGFVYVCISATSKAITFICSRIYANKLPGSKPREVRGLQRGVGGKRGKWRCWEDFARYVK